jgi:alkylation response protein AidB-like acyl-CoA dehydrogenase
LARTTCREAAASWLTGIIEGRVRPACAPRTLADLALHDLPAIEGIEGAWKLTGSVPRLQVTPDVTHAILQARSPEGEAMLLIVPLEREGLDLVIEETVDLTLASGHLTAAGVDVQDAEIIGDECETCQDAHRVASLLYGLALDMTAVGGASAAIEATIAYVSQRTQFGAVIGSFQAIQHQIANAYIEVELARSLVIDACRMLEDGLGTDVESAASYSRLFASQMYVKTSQVAIQCHGGYGFTWEQGIHGFYKRAIYGRQFASSTSRHRAVVANALRATAQQDGERHR